jgi:hypothetical protein
MYFSRRKIEKLLEKIFTKATDDFKKLSNDKEENLILRISVKLEE